MILSRLSDVSNTESWASRLRLRRVRAMLDLIGGCSNPRILDVGGEERFWTNVWKMGMPKGISITLLNTSERKMSGLLPIQAVVGDARDLSQFGVGEFDIAFSNSVIEHVGTLMDQRKMAEELRRVAKHYFLQTPYRYFPIEAHFHVPGWAQLPVALRTYLHRRVDLGWMKAEPDYILAKSNVEQVRLLNLKEFRALFPEARIVRECIGPFLKSMIAIG